MGTASSALEKKPAQSTNPGNGPRCFCNRQEEDHPRKDCKEYIPRPCTCGHPFSMHLNRCRDSGCNCRRFSQDDSPEYLLRMGVRAGEWHMNTNARLEFFMRAGEDPKTRVLAVIMEGASLRMGRDKSAYRNQGRLAVIKDPRTDELVPLQPSGIVARLNGFEALGRMTQTHVRRAIRECEQDGIVRQVGKTRKHIRLFCYAKPLKWRELPDLEEVHDRRWPPEPPENLVAQPGHQIPVTPTIHRDLREKVILPIKQVLGKTFRENLRQHLEEENLVAEPGHEKALEELLDKIANVAWEGYQTLLLVACPGGAIKEVVSGVKEEESSSSALAVNGRPVKLPAKNATTMISDSSQSNGKTSIYGSSAGKQNPKPDTEQVRTVMQEICGGTVALDAAHALISGCRREDPNCTTEQILEKLREVAADTDWSKIKSPKGHLITSVAARFLGGYQKSAPQAPRTLGEYWEREREREQAEYAQLLEEES